MSCREEGLSGNATKLLKGAIPRHSNRPGRGKTEFIAEIASPAFIYSATPVAIGWAQEMSQPLVLRATQKNVIGPLTCPAK
jgi:replicative DNA helicase